MCVVEFILKKIVYSSESIKYEARQVWEGTYIYKLITKRRRKVFSTFIESKLPLGKGFDYCQNSLLTCSRKNNLNTGKNYQDYLRQTQTPDSQITDPKRENFFELNSLSCCNS